MNKNFENNAVEIAGEAVTKPEYNHEVYGERFYIFKMSTKRLSGAIDIILVTISERLINPDSICIGIQYKIFGQFRSFNCRENNRSKLILSIFASDIEELDDRQSGLNINNIELDGFICKEPVYRRTPLDREITDLLMAVNRGYGKSDYIPCIAWGRNAKFSSCLEVGTHISICGRIQSREYQKRISDTEYETRTAYEVSVSKIELVEEE